MLIFTKIFIFTREKINVKCSGEQNRWFRGCYNRIITKDMKKITLLAAAAALTACAASAQDAAPSMVQAVSVNYNNNTLYPKDADHYATNGFGVNYTVDFSLSKSYPVYLGTGLNFQFLFRSENLLDKELIDATPLTESVSAKLKTTMIYMDIPVNVSYRVPLTQNITLTPLVGLDLKVQLDGKARLNVDGNFPSAELAAISRAYGMAVNRDINFYDDDDMDGDAFNRFQFGWHAGLRLSMSDFFVEATYGTDFTKLHRNLGEGTFKVGVGYEF